ncbi:class I SAM-dependent methyltransferase [Paenibacillus sp. M1]|uniref:Class I SAM-dependent methyltransferase n=1 Tax=Paenibacillus haidiansis TaxID=1574488 RepID=A0ABU7VPY7_9BACL
MNLNAVVSYYEDYDESSRLTTDNSRRLEFITTTYALDKYISNGRDILELGAGMGIYSFYYAEKGNTVTSTDITPKLVQYIQEKIDRSALENIRARELDARDLSAFAAGSFDAVLCLGPMYHLVEPADQRKCINECLRVLKPNGVLAVAYVNRFLYCLIW